MNLNEIILKNSIPNYFKFTNIDLNYFYRKSEENRFVNYFSSFFKEETNIKSEIDAKIYALYKSISDLQNNYEPIMFGIKDLTNDILVGFALVGVDPYSKTFKIDTIYVLGNYRKLGLGNALVDVSIQLAKFQESKVIKLKTLKSYKFIVEMYKKFGFIEHRIIPNELNEIGLENFVEYIKYL